MTSDWTKASRESANIAPLASIEKSAQVHLYVAKAFSWRGFFSVHSWIAIKEENAPSYKVFHVLMWKLFYDKSAVSIEEDLPDRLWFNAKPEIIFSASKEKAKKMIPQIYAAAKSYPYSSSYRAYPGPNSNSFISYIMRSTNGFTSSLPSNAIGKDWLCNGKFFSLSETRTGLQFSLYGLIGVIIGLYDGLELNIIGLSFGIDFIKPALKLPLIGRIDKGFFCKIWQRRFND